MPGPRRHLANGIAPHVTVSERVDIEETCRLLLEIRDGSPMHQSAADIAANTGKLGRNGAERPASPLAHRNLSNGCGPGGTFAHTVLQSAPTSPINTGLHATALASQRARLSHGILAAKHAREFAMDDCPC